MRTKPGEYYGVSRDGRLVPLEPDELLELLEDGVALPVTAHLCRRVADFPAGRPPSGAGLAPCAKCGVPLAYQADGPHADRPKLCLQCAGIQPLPITAES